VLHPFRGGSTWYASLISLNCFSANSLRSGFLSGCHFSAALLYLRCGRFGCSAPLQGADALRAGQGADLRTLATHAFSMAFLSEPFSTPSTS
jgi:hypothetical protein